MLLVGVRENNNWLASRWNLTYPTGWEQILKGAAAIYDYYGGPEILVDGNKISISSKEEILSIREGRNLTLRGISNIIKTPLMITFVNQTNIVDVTVPMAGEEFAHADYQKFNISLCQYLDSLELAMHRA